MTFTYKEKGYSQYLQLMASLAEYVMVKNNRLALLQVFNQVAQILLPVK